MSKLIEIGALWSSQGNAVATGNLGGKGGARLVLLDNDKRGNDRAPDFRLFIAPDERREERRPAPEDENQAAPDDDGIPF